MTPSPMSVRGVAVGLFLSVTALTGRTSAAASCPVDKFGAIIDSIPEQADNPMDVRIVTKSLVDAPVCVYDPVVDRSVTLLDSPPASLETLESESSAFLFVESTRTSVTAPLTVDILFDRAAARYVDNDSPNWCGPTWGDANANKCGSGGTACPGGTNTECPSGESCFGGFACPAEPSPSTFFCGVGWTEANDGKCGAGAVACPGGTDTECPSGQSCFNVFACDGANELASQEANDPTLVSVGSSSDGTYGNPSSLADVLPAGTYSSYLFHADAPDGSALTALLTGSVTFPQQEIVGLILTPSSLAASDAVLGSSSTVYAGSAADRGFEFTSEFQDFLTFSESCIVDVSALTCPETDASQCPAASTLGLLGPPSAAAAGGQVASVPYPNINTLSGSILTAPNGRDDTVAFLVGGNYVSVNAAEVEGRMVILGDMTVASTGANTLVFAGYGSGIIPNDGTDFLQVGGDITVDRTVAVGTAGYRGTVTYGGTLAGSGTLAVGAQGSLVNDPGIDLSEFTDILADITAKSEEWALLSPNGVFTGYLQGPNSNTALFEAGPDNACVQVFSIDADELSPPYGIIAKFTSSIAGKTVLVNVNAPPSGVVNVQKLLFEDAAGNQNYDFSTEMVQNIIWNFHDATTLVLGDCDNELSSCDNGEFIGSIIAPKADTVVMKLPGQSGRFVAGGDVIHDWFGSEFHNYPSDPTCPLPSPPDLPLPDECTTPPPTECPPDVELVYQTGSIDWDATGDIPIQIVSSDTTSVTFTVTNTFSTTAITKLYTQFNEDVAGIPNQVCFLEENVSNTQTIEYTAMCSHTTKIAIVDLYLEDGNILTENGDGDTTSVPRCCHDDSATPLPALQYAVKLECDPEPCPVDEETSSARKLEIDEEVRRRSARV